MSPSHRVTFLTAYLAYSVTRHVAWNLSDLLFMPLEALFVRSVAHGFISSPQAQYSAAVTHPHSQILTLGTWFGLGLKTGWWRGIVRYAGKLGFWWGVQVGAGYLIWQIGAGIVWWLAPGAGSTHESVDDRRDKPEDP